MNFTKFTLGGLPECQKVFFYRTSFVCYQGGPKHYHAVLGADLGKNTGKDTRLKLNILRGNAAHGLLKRSLVDSQPMSGIPYLGPANFVALTVLQPIAHYLKTE